LKKVFVIGSNSFSGSDFVQLLLETGGYHVIGISRSPELHAMFLPYKTRPQPNFEFHQLNLHENLTELLNLIDMHEPEFIINFAAHSEVATSWDHPGHCYQTNTLSVVNFCDALKTKQYLKRYVHISTPEVYGTCAGNISEDAPLNPSTPYAASKASADLFLLTLFKHYQFPVVTVRSTNVYGAYQQLYKIIPRSIIYMRNGRKIQLHGGGKAIKTFIHIRDVSRGELLVMEKGIIGSIYHFSSGEGIAIRSLVEQIAHKVGVDFEQAIEDAGERLGQDAAYTIDSTKARTELNWQSEITLAEGIDQVMTWVDQYWQDIQIQTLEYVHKE
jgi:dTDP-glucose 4,6-dehydratase